MFPGLAAAREISTMSKTEAPKTTATKATGSFDVKALRTKLGASREVLAKLLGVSAASILNWESGKPIVEKNVARLRELASKAEKGEDSLPPRKKPGRPKKGTSSPSAGKATSKTAARVTRVRSRGSSDVRALRTRLGASREVFAKLLGVSPGSVLNWETPGKAMTAKNVAKLEELAAKADQGQVKLPAPKPRGRPPVAGATSEGAGAHGKGRATKASISGSLPATYANVVDVTRGDREALIRFALAVPGANGARVVSEMLVPIEALASFRG